MSAIPVPTVNINALYTNTTSGTDADPQVMDNAIIDIVSTINANATEQNNNTAAAVLPHADGSVTTAKLADLSVTTAKIAASAVTTAKLADANVTTAKIADSNVTLAKMADASVGTAELVDGAVTTAKIAIGAVGVAQLSPAAAVNETVNNALIVALSADTTQRGINVKYPPPPLVAAVGDGVANDTAAFAAVLAYVIANGKMPIRIPESTYLLDEWIINAADISIIGEGKVTLKARSNSKTLLRISAASCHVNECIALDNNGKTGCYGLGLIPADETQSTVVVDQSYNKIRIKSITGFDEAIVMQCGPTVLGVTSGCYYNDFFGVRLIGNKRNLWLKDATVAGGSSVNRNNFYSMRFGQGSNTGLQIDSGDTNTFYSCHFEGINSGVTPNATRTAIKISSLNAAGAYNGYNTFFGCMFEANTYDLTNENTSTAFYGCNLSFAKMNGSVLPKILIPFDTSVTPFIIPGATLYNNTGSTITPSVYNFDYPPVDTGYDWKTFALTTSNMTNVSHIYKAWSEYKRLGKMVDWHFRVNFTATAATTVIDVNLPVNAENNMYLDVNFMETMHFSAVVATVVSGNYAYQNVVCYFIAGNKIRIVLPTSGWTAWNIANDYNMIHVMLRYRSA